MRDQTLWMHLGFAALAAIVAFSAAMPHALLDMDKFLADQNEERRKLITGQDDVPFTRQYSGTLPFLFYAENLIRWTQFYPLGLLSIVALGSSAWLTVRALLAAFGKSAPAEAAPRARARAVLVSWCAAYLVVVGASFAKFNRYMLPITP